MGKKKVKIGGEFGKDRMSGLSDEVIHKILSFLDAKVAVQTSVLSKRWRCVWSTLPFLNFGGYEDCSPYNTYMFIRHVLSNRFHRASVSELNMCVSEKKCVLDCQVEDGCLVEKFVEYAISHDVKCLTLDLLYEQQPKPFRLSTLSSNSLKKLTLRVERGRCLFSSDWNLPVLTTLCLLGYDNCLFVDKDDYPMLSDSPLTCLPALITLSLVNRDLSYSFDFSLPNLTSLSLDDCRLPEKVWNFPALLTLHLLDVSLPNNINHIFSTLVNLQNLTIVLGTQSSQKDLVLSCPQLLNLNLTMSYCFVSDYNIVVLAPKLLIFTCVGIFPITFGVPELETVNIKLLAWFKDMTCEEKEKYYLRFTHMLLGLGKAKNLSFDLESIEALSAISNFLSSFPSPFYNLKRVKLPRGYEESSISSALRSYLFSGSPRATIVTTLSQDNIIPQTAAVSMTAQNEVIQEPLVQEHHAMGNSLVDANRVRHIDSLNEGANNNQGSSTGKNKGFGLWRGHEVNREFVCLLDNIMLKYPETFEHFSTKSKKLCTMNLNMLCTSLNDFTKISMNEVDSDMIVGYKDVYAYLHNQGFDVSWVVNRLNYIEQLRFSKPLIPDLHALDCCIDDAKSKVQDLQSRVDDAKTKLQDVQTLRMEKMTEIEKAFGTMGTKLAVGFIGDDLLSVP